MTAILAMLRRMHAEVDDGEGIVNEGFPSGSKRGLTYRQITLMLGKHHQNVQNKSQPN